MADFNYYLNRQGSRGQQGPQGIQGFSPVITVATNTLSEYILHIVTQDNEFDTVNLREHKEDLGGTYIRYNRETGVMYAGDIDIASSSQMGIVRFATATEVAAGDVEEAVPSVADVTDMINAKGYDEAIARVQDNLDAAVLDVEADIGAEALARQAADGVLQSSIDNLRNSLVNYVDLTSNQTINGVKRFNYLRANAIQSLGNGHTLISYDDSNQRLTLGGISASDVKVTRNGDTYTNIDTGNLNDYVDIDIATTQTAGIVKPDGTSITVDNDGTIHSTAGAYELPTASTTTKGGIKIDGTTVVINDETLSAVPYQLPTASDQVKGGVKVDGTSITINNEVISATPYTLPTASTQTLGGVKVDGTTITIDNNGVISGASTYELPTASTSTLGGVKIDGQTINIDANGVISASTGAVIDDSNVSSSTTYSSSKIENRLGEVELVAREDIDGGAPSTISTIIRNTIDGDTYSSATMQGTNFEGENVVKSFNVTVNNIVYTTTATFKVGNPRIATYTQTAVSGGQTVYEQTITDGILTADYTVVSVFPEIQPVQTPNIYEHNEPHAAGLGLKAGTYNAIRRSYPNAYVEQITLNSDVIFGYTSDATGTMNIAADNAIGAPITLSYYYDSETGTNGYEVLDMEAFNLYVRPTFTFQGTTADQAFNDCVVGRVTYDGGDAITVTG